MMSATPPPPPYQPQYPPQYPPQPPLGYATAYVPPPDPRPRSLKVVSILAIIFGSIGALGGLCSLPQYLGVQLTPNPVIDAMRDDALAWGFAIGAMLAGTVLAIVELTCGIGAWQLRPWGRAGLVAMRR
jgi:hypothetical protein